MIKNFIYFKDKYGEGCGAIIRINESNNTAVIKSMALVTREKKWEQTNDIVVVDLTKMEKVDYFETYEDFCEKYFTHIL